MFYRNDLLFIGNYVGLFLSRDQIDILAKLLAFSVEDKFMNIFAF